MRGEEKLNIFSYFSLLWLNLTFDDFNLLDDLFDNWHVLNNLNLFDNFDGHLDVFDNFNRFDHLDFLDDGNMLNDLDNFRLFYVFDWVFLERW